MKLGAQFTEKIKKQMIPMRKEGAKHIAEGIIDQMKQNVDQGVGFDSGASYYKREYSERAIRERTKGGFQVRFTDLQRANRRVKSVYAESQDDRATIRFRSGGNLMFYHQWGIGNNPRRQLFPDVQGGGQDSPGNGDLVQPESMTRITRSTLALGAKLMNKPV